MFNSQTPCQCVALLTVEQRGIMCPFADRVHGAYGESSVPYELADQLILVAGGVGATPLVSILGDLLSKATSSTSSSSSSDSSTRDSKSSFTAHSQVTLHVYALRYYRSICCIGHYDCAERLSL
jgi:hypothetical protein